MKTASDKLLNATEEVWLKDFKSLRIRVFAIVAAIYLVFVVLIISTELHWNWHPQDPSSESVLRRADLVQADATQVNTLQIQPVSPIDAK